MKSYELMLWAGIVITILLISGCIEEEKFVCEKPYIQVGKECCLDENDNKICDKDELKEEGIEEIVEKEGLKEDEVEEMAEKEDLKEDDVEEMVEKENLKEEEIEKFLENFGEVYEIPNKKALPDIPEESPVYEITAPEVTKQSILHVAKEFLGQDLNENQVEELKNYYSLKSGNGKIKLYKNSMAIFYKTNKLFQSPDREYDMSDDEVKKIADDYLNKHNLKPTNPDDELVFSNIRHLEDVNPENGRKIVHTEVLYTRKIGGKNVMGSGSKMVVYIGNDREVIGLYKLWRPIKNSQPKMVENLNLNETLVKMYNEDEKYYNKIPEIYLKEENTKIIIEKGSYGYHAEGKLSEQKEIYPAVLFARNYSDGDYMANRYVVVQTQM